MMRLLILIFSLTIAGCAATAPRGDSDYSDLYSGRSKLVFGTELPVDSAANAMSMGDQAYRGGELDKALFHYIRAVELDDSTAVGFHRIGLVHKQRGNLRLASRAFRLALERDERHVAALEELGLMRLQNQQFEQAGRFFDRVLVIDPDRVRAHNGLGVIADLGGDHEQAADRFRRALNLQPEATHIMNNLGYSLYLSGNWGEAEETYRQVLRLDPKHELATRNLALLYVRRGHQQQALSLLEKVGSAAAANNDVGYLSMLDGQYDTADRFFEKAIELSPVYYEKANSNLARNRQLALRAPNPRLARVFSPDPVRTEERTGPETKPAAATSEPKTPAPATQAVLTDIDTGEPPIIESEPIPAEDTQSPSAGSATAGATESESGYLYLKRYVRADVLNVRDDSRESASVLDKIRNGHVVRVLRRSGPWAYVLYWQHRSTGFSSHKGWVHASFLSETDSRGLS